METANPAEATDILKSMTAAIIVPYFGTTVRDVGVTTANPTRARMAATRTVAEITPARARTGKAIMEDPL